MTVDELLPDAFRALVSDVLFVESTIEAADQIFSFSDDSAPNVLYIAPMAEGCALAPDHLADSLLHEFLHQQLYHMDADERMLLTMRFGLSSPLATRLPSGCRLFSRSFCVLWLSALLDCRRAHRAAQHQGAI